MRVLGAIILGASLIAIALVLGMDTTVSSGSDSRVHNIGLMNEKQNLLIVFGAVAIVGTLLFALASRSSSGVSASSAAQNSGIRVCPFCAEAIQEAAIICRYCQRDLHSTDSVEPGNPASSNATTDELAAKYGILFDGKQYVFGEYKYHRLEDALAYAELTASSKSA